jgi:hypothetical protein
MSPGNGRPFGLNRIVVGHAPGLCSSDKRGDANKLALAVESENEQPPPALG